MVPTELHHGGAELVVKAPWVDDLMWLAVAFFLAVCLLCWFFWSHIAASLASFNKTLTALNADIHILKATDERHDQDTTRATKERGGMGRDINYTGKAALGALATAEAASQQAEDAKDIAAHALARMPQRR